MNKEEYLDRQAINTIRFLCVDMVEKAKSGHPGMPMGMAAAAYVLWTKYLRHNPRNPNWPDRDRFILSAGHGSTLLYALLHLTGYELSLEDLKRFRQWGSLTPGHPEYGHTPGVEATTGPLGQGLGMAVGMAIAEAHLAARFNTPGYDIVNHHTFVIAGDGDLMEGVGSEAASLAGHLHLGKLIVLFDSNRVSLAGTTSLCFTEDVGRRFEAYGWNVQHLGDGNDLKTLEGAIRRSLTEKERPSLIIVRTVIGYGAPHKQGTFEAHGSPLGRDEALAAKKNMGWPVEPDFLIPEDVLRNFRKAVERGKTWEAQWQETFAAYRREYPERAAEYLRMLNRELPADWDRSFPVFQPTEKGIATRKASESAMQALAAAVPEFVGGSADLNPSTLTWLKGMGDFECPKTNPADTQGAVGGVWGYEGRNIHYGVREHAMGAITNGLALHGGFIPYGSTFLVFSDYMRPAIRLAALMNIHCIFVFTHDSIAVGEDGPTHQPVEHLMSLRAIPNLTVLRPADANETAAAWRFALQNRGPVALILTRQNLPVLDADRHPVIEGVPKGAYIIADVGDLPEVILMATGSEVHLALSAFTELAKRGLKTRVVSMPSWELFQRQPRSYRDQVIPPDVRARLAVEAGSTLGWWKWVGDRGDVVGLDGFGASAPGGVVMEKYGFTVENIVRRTLALLDR